MGRVSDFFLNVLAARCISPGLNELSATQTLLTAILIRAVPAIMHHAALVLRCHPGGVEATFPRLECPLCRVSHAVTIPYIQRGGSLTLIPHRQDPAGWPPARFELLKARVLRSRGERDPISDRLVRERTVQPLGHPFAAGCQR